MRSAKFASSKLYGVHFSEVDLRSSSFESCSLSGTSFNDCDLKDSTFTNVDLNGAWLEDADLNGVKSTGLWGTPSSMPEDWRIRNGQFEYR